MVSVIIPAYNEEAVIGRTLKSLVNQTEIADLEVIVCCNGCKDRTAEIAREFGPSVRVLETARGSKTLALNMGDAAATSFPRIYLDADIILSPNAIKSIVAALNNPAVLAVAPRMRVDLSGRNWPIRAFYEVWLKTPYHMQGMIGSGIYALSERSRQRFDEFPEIIADDAFVRAHFGPEERQTLEDCSFTVIPPASFSGLLRIKTRATLGNKELSLKFPGLMRQLAESEASQNGRKQYWKLAMNPANWAQIGVYTFVKAVAALRAKSQLKRLGAYQWERDETSRA